MKNEKANKILGLAIASFVGLALFGAVSENNGFIVGLTGKNEPSDGINTPAERDNEDCNKLFVCNGNLYDPNCWKVSNLKVVESKVVDIMISYNSDNTLTFQLNQSTPETIDSAFSQELTTTRDNVQFGTCYGVGSDDSFNGNMTNVYLYDYYATSIVNLHQLNPNLIYYEKIGNLWVDGVVGSPRVDEGEISIDFILGSEYSKNFISNGTFEASTITNQFDEIMSSSFDIVKEIKNWEWEFLAADAVDPSIREVIKMDEESSFIHIINPDFTRIDSYQVCLLENEDIYQEIYLDEGYYELGFYSACKPDSSGSLPLLVSLIDINSYYDPNAGADAGEESIGNEYSTYLSNDKSLEYISQYYSKSYPGTYRLRFQNISTNGTILIDNVKLYQLDKSAIFDSNIIINYRLFGDSYITDRVL